MGCGMVDPEVLKLVDLDPEKMEGFCLRVRNREGCHDPSWYR